MVALDEDREIPALPDSRTQYHGDVFGGALVGVGDLGPGDLQDDGSGVAGLGGPEDGPGGIVSQHSDVDGRDGEAGALTPSACQVQLMDRGRIGPGRLPDLPEEPSSRFELIALTENRQPHYLVRHAGLEG